MESSAIIEKGSGYVLKYSEAESYYKNSLLLECIQNFSDLMKGKVLDLGCGNKPYYKIYSKICDSSIGSDVPFSLHQNANVEVICYAEDIDKHLEKNYFDCVLCTEVLEHTVNDQKVINNINKVLKTGGSLIISSPFIYVLHEAPHDYRRYTLFGLKSLLESHRFQIQSIISLGGTFSSGFFILYYAFTKTFFYSLKKIGLKDPQKNRLLKSVLSFPEFLFYKVNHFFFRQKLRTNTFPTKNEMFSSLGYFIIAKKLNDLA